MWRLGDDLAVRMQRMDKSPDLQLKERRWLPVLASRLPLPIPTPVRSGTPSERFPKMWTVMTWVEGRPLDHGSITRGDHAADMLAAFLKALHVEAPADAPDASDFGAHPKECTGGFEHFLGAVDLGGFAEDDIRAVWDDAVAAFEWQGPRVWVHGDLHPANVVIADGTLAGIVDFGAVFAGDPAWDLAAAWVLLPAGGASRFFDSYARAGPGDGPTGARAGRDEEPVLDADGPERRPGPTWRQAELGARRLGSARSRPDRQFDVARSGRRPSFPAPPGSFWFQSLVSRRVVVRDGLTRDVAPKTLGPCRSQPPALRPFRTPMAAARGTRSIGLVSHMVRRLKRRSTVASPI